MRTIASIPAAFAVAMMASTAQAGVWDNPDTMGGILHTLERPGYVGTSLADHRARLSVQRANPAFPNGDIDETGFAVGTAGPEGGHGDLYGHVVYSSRR